jgi:hypothetical protein
LPDAALPDAALVAVTPRTPPAFDEPVVAFAPEPATCELAACDAAACDVWDVCEVCDVFDAFERNGGTRFWKTFVLAQLAPVGVVTDSVFVFVCSAFPCLRSPYA